MKERPDVADRYCKYCRQARGREAADKQRWKAIELIGSVCVCCGEAMMDFLEIDHIDGYKEGPRSGQALVRYVLAGHEKEFQVLCRNCNWAKFNRGSCPHGGV